MYSLIDDYEIYVPVPDSVPGIYYVPSTVPVLFLVIDTIPVSVIVINSKAYISKNKR